MSRKLPSILWIAALLLVAIVACGAQLDRQSRIDPELAELVPAPFRAFAQYRISADAIIAGDSASAQAEVGRLIARRPIPAEHLSLLAIFQLGSDPQGRGLTTIQISAQRGWREPLAQEARLRLALSAGDEREAAARLAAIWALGANNPKLAELAPLVLQGEGARQAFAQILAEDPRWAAAFLRRGPQLLDYSAFLDVLARANVLGGQFDCSNGAASCR